MLTDRSAAGINWAQIGLSYSQTQGTEIFTQVTKPTYPGTETTWSTVGSAGTYPVFTVLYNFVPGAFTFQLNGSQFIPDGMSGGYNPTAYFTPHDVEVSTELHNWADQIPGGTSNHTGHFDAHYYYSGAWADGSLTTVSFSVPAGLDPSVGSLAYYNGKTFYVWDPQCAS